MMQLAGRRILVTGAGGGIGGAIAARLAREGAEVIATDLATGLPCDITDRAAVDALLAQAGPLWAVVHAAALCGGSGRFEEVTQDYFARYIAVNLTGSFNLLQAGARVLIAGGKGGRIVAIGSVNAIAAEHGASPYAAAKGGLRMLVKAAAVDLARHGITVNLVHPGPITVPRNAQLFGGPSMGEGFARLIPMGAPGQPDAVAAAVIPLLLPEMGYVTGAEIAVDGGLLAGIPDCAP